MSDGDGTQVARGWNSYDLTEVKIVPAVPRVYDRAVHDDHQASQVALRQVALKKTGLATIAGSAMRGSQGHAATGRPALFEIKEGAPCDHIVMC